MTWRDRLRRVPRQPQRYISQDVLAVNQQMLNNVFRVNEQVLDVLRLLEPYADDERAAYEIRRLTAFREVAIEFAAWLYEDEGDLLMEPVLDRFHNWLSAKIESASSQLVDAATLIGYRTLATDIEMRHFTAPKPDFP